MRVLPLTAGESGGGLLLVPALALAVGMLWGSSLAQASCGDYVVVGGHAVALGGAGELQHPGARQPLAGHERQGSLEPEGRGQPIEGSSWPGPQGCRGPQCGEGYPPPAAPQAPAFSSGVEHSACLAGTPAGAAAAVFPLGGEPQPHLSVGHPQAIEHPPRG